MAVSSLEEGGFDIVFTALKWNGRYQVLQIALSVGCSLPIVFSTMSIIFIGYNVPSHCREINDTSHFEDYGIKMNASTSNITYGECDITIRSNLSEDIQLSCVNGYEYSQPRDKSLNSEWELVCGKESLSDLLQTLFTAGTGIGSVFTILADRKGRKPTHCITGLCFLIISCGIAYAPSYISFAVLRVVLGAVMMGTSLSGTILYLEIVPTTHRSTMGAMATLVWAVSVVLYATAAYLMRDLNWRLHQLIIGLTLCYYLIMPWILKESFRWLAAMKKYDVIERNLRTAARMNGKNEEAILSLFRKQHGTNDKDNSQLQIQDSLADRHVVFKNKYLASEWRKIFTDKKILLISGIVWFMWLTDSLTYYGLTLTSTEFHSDKYIGFGLSAIMDVLAAPAYWFTVDRFGRKRCAMSFHLLAGISFFLSAIFQHFTGYVPSLSAAVTTFTLIGKFAVSTSFCVAWFYTPEIFPTTIRNLTLGLASGFARVGGTVAPFSRTLYRHYPWALGTIFGFFCIIVCILVRYLPETAEEELPQTIADMKRMLNKSSFSKRKISTIVDTRL